MSFLSPRSLARFEPLGGLGDLAQTLRRLGRESVCDLSTAGWTAEAWKEALAAIPNHPTGPSHDKVPGLAAFLSRLRAGGVIWVHVAPEPITAERAEALAEALQRVAGPTRVALLLVSRSPDPALQGTLSAGDDTWRYGWVAQLAPAAAPWQIDGRGWRQLLERALDAWPVLAPAPARPRVPPVEPPRPEARLEACRELAFPDGGQGARQRSLEGGAEVRLVSASEWSRSFGSGFRLHASCEEQSPARLVWSGIPRSGRPMVLSVAFGLAVAQSVPVLVDIVVTAEGRRVGLWTGWAGPERSQARLMLPDGPGTVDIRIEARYAYRAPHNGYAVIDIDPVTLGDPVAALLPEG